MYQVKKINILESVEEHIVATDLLEIKLKLLELERQVEYLFNEDIAGQGGILKNFNNIMNCYYGMFDNKCGELVYDFKRVKRKIDDYVKSVLSEENLLFHLRQSTLQRMNYGLFINPLKEIDLLYSEQVNLLNKQYDLTKEIFLESLKLPITLSIDQPIKWVDDELYYLEQSESKLSVYLLVPKQEYINCKVMSVNFDDGSWIFPSYSYHYNKKDMQRILKNHKNNKIEETVFMMINEKFPELVF